MVVNRADACAHRIGDGVKVKRRVSFSDMPPQVWEVSEMYPSTFFYSEFDVNRFRKDIKLKNFSTTLKEISWKDTSSALMILFTMIAIFLTNHAAAACLPLLLGYRIFHFFYGSDSTTVFDASVDLRHGKNSCPVSE